MKRPAVATLGPAQRQRLFELPRSSWQDYDKALISKGGGCSSGCARPIRGRAVNCNIAPPTSCWSR